MFPASRSSSRRRTTGALIVLLLSGLCAAGWTPAQAQASLITVASFNGRDGDDLEAGVTFDRQGNLFGTTQSGGTKDLGTVFEITAAGLPASENSPPLRPARQREANRSLKKSPRSGRGLYCFTRHFIGHSEPSLPCRRAADLFRGGIHARF